MLISNMSPGDPKRCDHKFFQVAAHFYLTICALSTQICFGTYMDTRICTHTYLWSTYNHKHVYTLHIHAYTHTCTHFELSPYYNVLQ